MNMHVSDAQALAFVQGQAYKVNQTVYETRYPDWDFSRLIFVDTSGPEWSPGVLTYTSDLTGVAKWQSAAAKDVPMADVSQAMVTKSFHMAAIGYQYNIEEVNTTLAVPGASLPNRRARAARLAYQKFMYSLTLAGNTEKGLGGLINYPGVNAAAVAAGASTSLYWVDTNGVGQKTPAEILKDINRGLQGVALATYETELADTILLPPEAYNYIAATPYSATTMETILSFVLRTNVYTLTTGRQLTIRTVRELSTAGTTGGGNGKGRMVVYKNDPEYVKLHLPMPHRFLPVWQDGPMNYAIPGIFRTGGVELLTTVAMRYLDGVSEAPA